MPFLAPTQTNAALTTIIDNNRPPKKRRYQNETTDTITLLRKLPPKFLHNVVGLLGKDDRLSMRQVNKWMRSLVDDSKRSFFFSDRIPSRGANVRAIFSKLECLDVRFCKDGNFTQFAETLRHLKLHCPTVEASSMLLKTLASIPLISLDVGLTSFRTPSADETLGAPNTSLQRLKLHQVSISHAALSVMVVQPALRKLDLCFSTIAGGLPDTIGGPFLSAVCLDYNTPHPSDASVLQLALSSTITRLSLAATLNAVHLGAPVDRHGLPHNGTVELPRLSDRIVDALGANQSLHYLNLSNNFLGVPQLITLSLNKTIKVLRINGCGIDDLGARALSGFQQLMHLSIVNNYLTIEGAAALVKNLCLISLSIQARQLGVAGARLFANAPLLRELQLTHSDIGDQGLRILWKNTCLQCLSIGPDTITGDGLNQLHKHPSIHTFVILGNHIGALGALALGKLQFKRLRFELSYPGNHEHTVSSLMQLRAMQPATDYNKIKALHLVGEEFTQTNNPLQNLPRDLTHLAFRNGSNWQRDKLSPLTERVIESLIFDNTPLTSNAMDLIAHLPQLRSLKFYRVIPSFQPGPGLFPSLAVMHIRSGEIGKNVLDNIRNTLLKNGQAKEIKVQVTDLDLAEHETFFPVAKRDDADRLDNPIFDLGHLRRNIMGNNFLRYQAEMSGNWNLDNDELYAVFKKYLINHLGQGVASLRLLDHTAC